MLSLFGVCPNIPCKRTPEIPIFWTIVIYMSLKSAGHSSDVDLQCFFIKDQNNPSLQLSLDLHHRLQLSPRQVQTYGEYNPSGTFNPHFDGYRSWIKVALGLIESTFIAYSKSEIRLLSLSSPVPLVPQRHARITGYVPPWIISKEPICQQCQQSRPHKSPCAYQLRRVCPPFVRWRQQAMRK